MVRARWGYKSITGNFRENNEDRCLVHPAGKFFVVADGMGGQLAGEKASEMAVEIVPQLLEKSLDFDRGRPDDVSRVIDDAVSRANAEIMALGEIDPDFHNMGTTIALIVAAGNAFFVGGIGDSRAYLLRGDDLQQLTTDHSLTQALLEAGTISAQEAETHRYRNVLYRYLGTKEGSLGAHAKRIEPQAGDRFLLCSDGVSDGAKGDVLKRVLRDGQDPQATAEAVIKAAQEGGSKDNITAVVIFVDGT